jgi:uncharacterized protein
MNAPSDPAIVSAAMLDEQIDTACARIAPTWPLDQFIAVNPYWGWVGRPMPDAAAALGTLAGTRLTMPREWFRKAFAEGRFTREHLRHAVQASLGGKPKVPAATQVDAQAAVEASTQAAIEATVASLVDTLARTQPTLQRMALVTDLRDAGTPPRPGQSWTDLVTHQVSQHAAAFFDRHQAAWALDPGAGLFATWRDQLHADRGIHWRQGRSWMQSRLTSWPELPVAAIGAALDALSIPERGRTDYLSSLLMAIGGWAAWCAYERWQARLAARDDAQIVELLAIRITWERLLHDDAEPRSLPAGWAARWGMVDAHIATAKAEQHTDWLLQRAMELADQQPLIAGLKQATATTATTTTAPNVQAVFCIDVRSEVFRRALEKADPSIQTRGFAGFFGLPIAYSPTGSALERPQLPGLLAPAVCVTERPIDVSAPDAPALGQVLASRRRDALHWKQRWSEFRSAPASAFSFVESMGLLYAGKLLGDSRPGTAAPARWEDQGLAASEAGALRPCLPDVTSDPTAAAATAQAVLTAMGLVDHFAHIVLLAGHGSQTANNPHAAGLDCGACGGQTGEVNARVLADLLNNVAVREHLAERGIRIPSTTHFLPALHNTTTDQVMLHDTADVRPALQGVLADLRSALALAGRHARAERAPSLGLGRLATDPSGLEEAIDRRANDWAQVRPEWGLAGNAAFIVAPRARTRHLNLAGRSFLHDYDPAIDPTLSTLTLIMTAPMVVTHWINMQYHASTVDNRRYGSGNKVLHNVVGGRLGVFEGNGGDLRIGLPMQSLHDGHTLRHTPLRLAVYIEAPKASIDQVIAAHSLVHDLLANGWLHLHRIEPKGDAIERWTSHGWVAA